MLFNGLRRVILLLALTFPCLEVEAAFPASIALLVNESDSAKLKDALAVALKSSDAAVGAAAARVANVRNQPALLPELKEALIDENNPEAARELVRAVAVLGGKSEADFLVQHIKRFGTSLDGALASAFARLGVPDAIDLYWSHVRNLSTLGDTANYFKLALWSNPHFVTPVAARLLPQRDEHGWKALLSAAQDSEISPDLGVLLAAMKIDSEKIPIDTAWFLAYSLACAGELPACRSDLPPTTRDVLIADLSDKDPPEMAAGLSFAREIMRRIIGLHASSEASSASERSPEWLAWLKSDQARDLFITAGSRLRKYLTAAERKALAPGEAKPEGPATAPSVQGKLAPPPYIVPTPLFPGLANQIAAQLRCTSEWIGVGRTAVDATGRIYAVNLEKLEASKACRSTLDALIRLSMPVNASINSPRVDLAFLAVKGRDAPLCLDEPSVAQSPNKFPTTSKQPGEINPPIVKKRVDPYFSDAARKLMSRDRSIDGLVVVEAVISASGCVQHVRLVKQSRLGDLNREALLSVTHWQFEPAKLDGVPVETVFNLTVNFKLR